MPLPSADSRAARPGPAAGCSARLDDVDRAILQILADDARISNKELAERVGIAAVHLPGPGARAARSAG